MAVLGLGGRSDDRPHDAGADIHGRLLRRETKAAARAALPASLRELLDELEPARASRARRAVSSFGRSRRRKNSHQAFFSLLPVVAEHRGEGARATARGPSAPAGIAVRDQASQQRFARASMRWSRALTSSLGANSPGRRRPLPCARATPGAGARASAQRFGGEAVLAVVGGDLSFSPRSIAVAELERELDVAPRNGRIAKVELGVEARSGSSSLRP